VTLRRQLIVVLALVLAIVVPVGGIVAAAMLAPSPYRVVATPDAQWLSGQTMQLGPTAGQALLQTSADESAARADARRMLARLPTTFASSMAGVHHYRTDDGEHGLILAIDRYVLRVAAADEAALDRSVEAIPFIAANDDTGFTRFLDRHLVWVIVGVLAYALLLTVAASRMLGWAGRVPPLDGVPAASGADLRAKLHAVAFPGVIADDRDDGDIVFEIAEAGAVERLRLRLDADRRVVRATMGGTARRAGRWGLGLRAGAYGWRTLPHGPLRDEVASVVQSSGWTWQPVFTFVRAIGG
jgi:hypothetical protein